MEETKTNMHQSDEKGNSRKSAIHQYGGGSTKYWETKTLSLVSYIRLYLSAAKCGSRQVGEKQDFDPKWTVHVTHQTVAHGTGKAEHF